MNSKISNPSRLIIALSSISILLISNAVFGAGSIDSGFTGSAVRTRGSNAVETSIKTSVKQPDGKVLIGGNFTAVGDFARKGIARLNSDGTVDPTFNPPELDKTIYLPWNFSEAATITGIGLQTDGKIMVAGDFTKIDGVNIGRLVRLNSDGSLDSNFSNLLHQKLSQFEGTIYDIEILSDGKILLAGDNVGFLTQNFGRIIRPIVRLTADANYDETFNDPNVHINMSLRKIDVQADGRILVAGFGALSFNNVGLARLHSNGTLDFSFTGVVVGLINDFRVLQNGQIVIVGGFSSVNGFSVGRIARINADGSPDLSFNTNNAGANSSINTLSVQSDGKMIVGGAFSAYNTIQTPKLIRLNADGSIDSSFNYLTANDGFINELQSIGGGKLLAGGEGGLWDRIQVLNSDGSYSGVLNNLIGKGGLVNTVVLQSDDKILAAGRFVTASGESRNNLARYNVDGSIDSTFNPFVGESQLFIINRMVVQPDGKILIASQSPASIRRLNADGTKDLSFNVFNGGQNSSVNDIVLLPSGKYWAFGDSLSTTAKIERFNPNGTLDTVINTNIGTGFVQRAMLQPDGKFLIAGTFTQVAGSNRGRIARLNPDGTHDSTFNPPGGANNAVVDLTLQPDGKVVIVGHFDALNGSTARRYVGRLNADGSLDTGFSQTADAPLIGVGLQADGRVLVGGLMFNVGGVARRGIARLNSDGSVDNSFQIGAGTNNPVRSIVAQTDGKIIAGGEFTKYNGVSKIGIVRLLSAAPLSTSFDFDGDGRSDVSVFRPSTNRWYKFLSSNSTVVEETFGIAGDVVAPADYDGDGKTDIGIFRPSAGDWWYKSSINGGQVNVHWGASGDIPRPGDFDGDGKADFIVYRPSNGVWYRFGSAGQVSISAFGTAGDNPVLGDFDGDGKSDMAIFRPSTGDWWYQSSISNAQIATRWGISTDIPAPADFDGDGKTDLAVYRPSTGTWYIINSGNGSFTVLGFGLAGDKPVAADYDGDGKADVAVFRPSTGIWYLLRSTSGFTALQFGISTDIPTPNSFVP